MRRRKKEEPHFSHDRWLVSYADFITLLFAFFVVLYASSQVDKGRVGRLSQAIQVAFHEFGVPETSDTNIPRGGTEGVPFSNGQAVENLERTSEVDCPVVPMKAIFAPVASPVPMKDIQAELKKALAPEIKNHIVDLKPKREGLVVSLREIGFYDSGSPALRASSMGAMDRLAKVIIPRTENMRIEGHTDNVPIHNSRFASNWELSTARATELVRLFIVGYHVEPNRLSAAGFAEFHPVEDNGTSLGRARNRRVDIVILNPAFQERPPVDASRVVSPRDADSTPRPLPRLAAH